MTKPTKIHEIKSPDPASELDRIIQIQVELAKINTELPHLATKTELTEVKAELKAEIAEVKIDLKAEIAEVKAELKADIAELKTDIVKSRNTVIIWVIGIFIASGLINWLNPSFSHTHSTPSNITRTN